MPDLLPLDAIPADAAALVGGKAAGLGRLTAAGLPVPPGFVVTTAAVRRPGPAGVRADPALAQAVLDAYHGLGGGPVAVRSSAVAEDGAAASFAGQQDTVLGVVGDAALLDAIDACRRSQHVARAAAYRRRHHLPDDEPGLAVVVQRFVPADVAGVLFTQAPDDATGRLMAVEVAWGLGTAVVSGRVTPDHYRLDRETGAIVDAVPGLKTVRFTAAGQEAVPADLQRAPCLSDDQLSQLAALGRRVEAIAGGPQDVEWAFADGAFVLLQARPITAGGAAAREQVRVATVKSLRAGADLRGTAWVRDSLSEVLAAPTPMTWAVVGRLLAADGGVGAMHRDLGWSPDPALGSGSAYDLIAGRPMLDLSRLPRLLTARPLTEYPLAALKVDPGGAAELKPVLRPGRAGIAGWLRLPAWAWRLLRTAARTRRLRASFAREFPATAARFTAEARAALDRDWSALDAPAVAAVFDDWVTKTMVDFARHSLKATVFADLSWTVLVRLLTPSLGADGARAAVGEIAGGVAPPADADVAGGVAAFAAGELDRATFLARFGHRGRNEMELAAPRWADDPDAVDRLRAAPRVTRPDPGGWARAVDRLRLAGPARAAVGGWADRLRAEIALREVGKHALMAGYAVVRRALVELDARYRLNGGVFFLRPFELHDLIAGFDVPDRIPLYARLWRAARTLEVPPVLFSDDLDAIGRPPPVPADAPVFQGVGLSAGVAEGPALVLTGPTADPPDGPYVLVCPSADPAWVPLLAGAAGLVVEVGGVLSHGAIVAREFGVPAVAGPPDATRRLRTGRRVRVDGGRGTVTVADDPPPAATRPECRTP